MSTEDDSQAKLRRHLPSLMPRAEPAKTMSKKLNQKEMMSKPTSTSSIKIVGPQIYDDGRRRFNSSAGPTRFIAGIEETLFTEFEKGAFHGFDVALVSGGTKASFAGESPSVDGEIPLGTIGRNFRTNKLLSQATDGESLSVVSVNILSEDDRHRTQPTNDPQGSSLAISKSLQPMSTVEWKMIDSTGKTTLWLSGDNAVALCGTGLPGGGKDLMALVDNPIESQIQAVRDGFDAVQSMVEIRDGMFLPEVVSTGNTSLLTMVVFDEVVPTGRVPVGATRYLLDAKVRNLPSVHRSAAIRKKVACVTVATTSMTDFECMQVLIADIDSPAVRQSIFLDQWVTVKQVTSPGYSPVLIDRKDHIESKLKPYSRVVGKENDYATLSSPVEGDDHSVVQTRDLWLSDAFYINRNRVKGIFNGETEASSIRPSIVSAINNAYMQICGSGQVLENNPSDPTLQRDAQKVIEARIWLPSDMSATEDQVKKLETAIQHAIVQHYRDTTGNTQGRKPIVWAVTWSDIPSAVCKVPVVQIRVMTHLSDFCDIILDDEPDLTEHRLVHQSRRDRDDFRRVHIENEFWKMGVKALKSSRHPGLVALGKHLAVIGKNHWESGRRREKGFSNRTGHNFRREDRWDGNHN